MSVKWWFYWVPPTHCLLYRYYFFAGSVLAGSAFLAAGLTSSFLTAGLASYLFAGSAAKETVANANITSAIIDFILITYIS